MCDTARSAISKWNCLHDFRLFARMGINEPTSLCITIGEMPAPWTTCSNSMQGTLGNVLWIHLNNACFGNWNIYYTFVLEACWDVVSYHSAGCFPVCSSRHGFHESLSIPAINTTAWALPVWAAQPAPVRIRLWWERNHLQKASKCLDVLCPFVQLILTTQSLSIVHVDPWFSMRDQLSLDNAIARPSELLLV